jgi:NAD+ kinase
MALDIRSVAPDGGTGGEYLALNDAVLHKGGAARVIRLKVTALREEVGSYSADGIILATPTGSTAYSLSAGGPIVHPDVDCIIATPISPHTLSVRPLVLPAEEMLTVEVLTPSEELILTIDGQESERLTPGARVVVPRTACAWCAFRSAPSSPPCAASCAGEISKSAKDRSLTQRHRGTETSSSLCLCVSV